MKLVFNLSDERKMYFDSDIDPVAAVCYAYASDNNILSLFFSCVHNGTPLNEHFQIIEGEKSVSCCNWCIAK